MPEGHTIHRLAADHRQLFGGRPVRATSPQGKFADGAALVDGQVLADAAGARQAPLPRLRRRPAGCTSTSGLIGKYTFGDAPAPAAHRHRPAAAGHRRRRLRRPARPDHLRADHRRPRSRRSTTGSAPTRCAPATTPDRACAADLPHPDVSVAALLMDQKVIAGVGNVYRAEVLFRHGVDPYLPGRDAGPRRSGTRCGPTWSR